MFVLALSVELHLGEVRSLKAKRSVLKSIIEGSRRRYRVAVSEVDHQDTWQRSTIGLVAVSGSSQQVQEIIDECERYIWSFPDIQVLDTQRNWMELE